MDELKQATRKYRRLKRQFEKAREEVIEASLKALQDGNEPADVAGESPFTPGYLRTIAREAGLEPSKRGMKPRRG